MASSGRLIAASQPSRLAWMNFLHDVARAGRGTAFDAMIEVLTVATPWSAKGRLRMSTPRWRKIMS